MRGTLIRKKLKSNEKGITLIALVITIIVLLILAGVAISMLSGDNRNIKSGSKSKRADRRCTKERGFSTWKL